MKKLLTLTVVSAIVLSASVANAGMVMNSANKEKCAMATNIMQKNAYCPKQVAQPRKCADKMHKKCADKKGHHHHHDKKAKSKGGNNQTPANTNTDKKAN